MKEKPILFNTEMVRAILDGRKTQTRRIMKPQPPEGENVEYNEYYNMLLIHNIPARHGPFEVGDILWVRETWGDYREFTEDGESGFFYLYKADYPDGTRAVPLPETEKTDYAESWYLPRWRPSIHMPREAARIFLRAKAVRAERLQKISGSDCVAEGCDAEMLSEVGEEFTRGVFHGIWDSTIKKADLPIYGWDANPWVWVVEFERIKDGGNGDA